MCNVDCLRYNDIIDDLMTEQTETSSDAPVESGEQKRSGGRVVVRYGRMMQLGLFDHDLDAAPAPGMKLVIETERGTELGTVVINVACDSPWSIEDKSLEQYLADSGKGYPFTRGGRVMRSANPQDINDQHHLDKSAADEAGFCREQIKALALDMRLVAVEHILGGERAVFFFTSESRIDFRELVRRLAGQYHTRIEMRQIGARDEARLLADFERCGRQCCCREYLKLLRPISMRMAKVQKATLDPAKISGRCGRLMCCLRYEDKTYEEIRRKLPKRNTWVRTADGVVGKVIETQIITQLVRLGLLDKRQIAVPNEEIVERDMAGPPEPAPPAKPERSVKSARPPRRVVKSKSKPEPKPKPESPPDEEPSGRSEIVEKTTPDKAKQMSRKSRGAARRRRQPRRRGKKNKHPGALSAAPQVQSSDQSDRQGKKKHRREPPKNEE